MSEERQVEVVYDTFVFGENEENREYSFDLYHTYKKTNRRVKFTAMKEALGLLVYGGEDIEYNQALIEIACADGEVIGFCIHKKDSEELSMIRVMVCSPLYRGKNIGTELFNRTLINMSNSGYDTCALESSETEDNYNFWIKKGAKRVGTRYIGLFSSIEVGKLKISDIKNRASSLTKQPSQKIILKHWIILNIC